MENYQVLRKETERKKRTKTTKQPEKQLTNGMIKSFTNNYFKCKLVKLSNEKGKELNG